MPKRVLSYLVFAILMTGIAAGSLVVVVGLYLPFVALKAAVLTLTGKARPRLAASRTEAPV